MLDIVLFSLIILLMALQPLVGAKSSFENNNRKSDIENIKKIEINSNEISFAVGVKRFIKYKYKLIFNTAMIGVLVIIIPFSFLLIDATLTNDCFDVTKLVCKKIPLFTTSEKAALWQHWQSVIQLSIALSLGAIAVLRLRDTQEQGVSSLIDTIGDRLAQQEERMKNIFVPTGHADECLSQELSTDMVEDGERNPEPVTPEKLKALIQSANIEGSEAKEMIEMSSHGELVVYILFLIMGIVLSWALVYSSWNPNKFMTLGAAYSLFVFLFMSAFTAPITVIIQFRLLSNARRRIMTIKSKSDEIEEVLRENMV